MSHYFETPTGVDRRHQIRARIWGREYQFTSSGGVFSAHRLDLGTSVLFRHSDPPPDGSRLLDLGCGFGPIAIALAAEGPTSLIDAVDVNPRALELTAVNAAAIGAADRVRPMLPDEVAPEVRYDQIWSNPPIRIGKRALHQLLLRWFDRLNPGGEARMVVGRNLGSDSLANWLTDEGWPTEKLSSAKGFRILRVQRSAPPPEPETGGIH